MNLNQVTLPSTDLDKSVEFYEKLGLKLIVDAPLNYARFQCTEGDSSFSVHKVESVPQNSGTAVYFEREDLDTYVDKLINKGISFDEMPNDKRWLWREARLKDPDGNQIIIYHGGENRLNPPWRIN